MSKGWSYNSGQWWAVCDVCSKKTHAADIKHRWDGFLTCPSCFEERHPQDFVRARADKISVPFVRPQPPDIFVEGNPTNDDRRVNDNIVNTIRLN